MRTFVYHIGNNLVNVYESESLPDLEKDPFAVMTEDEFEIALFDGVYNKNNAIVHESLDID